MKAPLSLRVLRVIETSPGPVSTPFLIDLFCYGKNNPRQIMWNALRALQSQGFISHETRKSKKGHSVNRMTYWSPA